MSMASTVRFKSPAAIYYRFYTTDVPGNREISTAMRDAMQDIVNVLNGATYTIEVISIDFRRELEVRADIPAAVPIPGPDDCRLFWAIRDISYATESWRHELLLYRERDALVFIRSVSRSDLTIDPMQLDSQGLDQAVRGNRDPVVDDEWARSISEWDELTQEQLKYRSLAQSLFGVVRIFEFGTREEHSATELAETLMRLKEPQDRRGHPFRFVDVNDEAILAQRFGPNLAAERQFSVAAKCQFDQWLVLGGSERAEQRIAELFIQHHVDQAPLVAQYFHNLLKIKRIDTLVRVRKHVLEGKWNELRDLIDKAPANDARHVFGPIQDVLSQLGAEACAQEISGASIAVAAFNCRLFRDESVVSQGNGAWGIGGPCAIEQDGRLIAVAEFQAQTARDIGQTIRQQAAMKVEALRAEAEEVRNKLAERQKERDEHFERRFHLLEVFIVSVYVVHLAVEFSHGTWHVFFLLLAAVSAAYFTLRWIHRETALHAVEVQNASKRSAKSNAPPHVWRLLLILFFTAVVAAILLSVFGGH